MVSSIEVYRGAIQTRHCSSLYLNFFWPLIHCICRGTYKIAFLFLDVMADNLDVNAATCRCSPTDRKTNKDQKLNEANSDFCRSVVGTDSFSFSLVERCPSQRYHFVAYWLSCERHIEKRRTLVAPPLIEENISKVKKEKGTAIPVIPFALGTLCAIQKVERRLRLSCSSFPSSSSSYFWCVWKKRLLPAIPFITTRLERCAGRVVLRGRFHWPVAHIVIGNRHC